METIGSASKVNCLWKEMLFLGVGIGEISSFHSNLPEFVLYLVGVFYYLVSWFQFVDIGPKYIRLGNGLIAK